MLRYHHEYGKRFIRYCKAIRILPKDCSNADVEHCMNTQDVIEFAERVSLRADLHEKLDKIGVRKELINYNLGIYDKVPQEILPNIAEWCEDKELSDIKYKGLSIKMIQEYSKQHKELDFFDCLNTIVFWGESNNSDMEDFLFGVCWTHLPR